MRLFLGLDLPQELKNQIHQYLIPVQATPKGWEHPNDYHQTLLFIGEASSEDCELIVSRLNDFDHRPFKLTLDDFYFFPRRVMYLGFKESPELFELKDKIEKLFPEWVRPHSKPFIPHITVKRWQRYEYDGIVEGLRKNKFPQGIFFVNEICLFKSEKDELNRKYHVIFRKRFSGEKKD